MIAFSQQVALLDENETDIVRSLQCDSKVMDVRCRLNSRGRAVSVISLFVWMRPCSLFRQHFREHSLW
jgi:hypothetical protein